jgi:hypothetical protein
MPLALLIDTDQQLSIYSSPPTTYLHIPLSRARKCRIEEHSQQRQTRHHDGNDQRNRQRPAGLQKEAEVISSPLDTMTLVIVETNPEVF